MIFQLHCTQQQVGNQPETSAIFSNLNLLNAWGWPSSIQLLVGLFQRFQNDVWRQIKHSLREHAKKKLAFLARQGLDLQQHTCGIYLYMDIDMDLNGLADVIYLFMSWHQEAVQLRQKKNLNILTGKAGYVPSRKGEKNVLHRYFTFTFLTHS